MKYKTAKELEALLDSSIPVKTIKPRFNTRTGRAFIPATGDLVERQLTVTGVTVCIPQANASPQWVARGFIEEIRPSDGAKVAIFTSAPL